MITDIDIPATEVVREYAARWNELDPSLLMDLWAKADDVSYIAEELDDVLVGWDAIHSHLARTRSRLTSACLEVPRLWAREVSSTIAVAIFIVEWNLGRVEQSEMATSHTRVSAVLQAHDGQWKFIHFMEAPYYVAEGEDVSSNFLGDLEAPFNRSHARASQ